jgi:hypothetical protein
MNDANVQARIALSPGYPVIGERATLPFVPAMMVPLALMAIDTTVSLVKPELTVCAHGGQMRNALVLQDASLLQLSRGNGAKQNTNECELDGLRSHLGFLEKDCNVSRIPHLK